MALRTLLLAPDGNRKVLYLNRNDSEWNWNYNWLENDWNADNRSASLATIPISPLYFYQRSFVLRFDCAIHPTGGLLRRGGRKAPHIFCRPMTGVPTQRGETHLPYLISRLLCAQTVVFVLAEGIVQLVSLLCIQQVTYLSFPRACTWFLLEKAVCTRATTCTR